MTTTTNPRLNLLLSYVSNCNKCKSEIAPKLKQEHKWSLDGDTLVMDMYRIPEIFWRSS